MKQRGFLVWMVMAVMAASSALAQGKCVIDEKVINCWHRYLPSEPAAVEKKVTEEVQTAHAQQTVQEKTELKNADAGTDTGGSVTASTVKNFLPLLNLTGLFGVEEDDEMGTFAVDLNFLLPNRFKENNAQLQAVVDTEPSLYEPLTMALKSAVGEDGLEDAVKELEKGFGNYDDVKLSFTYNVLNKKLGRSFKRHAGQYGAFFKAIEEEQSEKPAAYLSFVGKIAGSGGPETPGDASDSDVVGTERSIIDIGRDSSVDSGSDAESMTFVALATEKLGFTAEALDDDPGKQQRALREAERLMAELEQAAAQEARINERIAAAVTSYRLPSFSKLLENNPQLHVSASWHFRDDLAGPDEKSVNITWERPMAPNLGDFNAEFEEGHGTTCQADPRKCLTAFRDFVAMNEEAIERGDRFSFSLEYMEADELMIDLPDQLTQPFQTDATEKLIVKAGWGRHLGSGNRLDAMASWEDVSDDPMRQDRGIAKVTLTRRLASGFEMPVSLVYATKTEFLDPLVDEQISAHFGIKYKMASPSSP